MALAATLAAVLTLGELRAGGAVDPDRAVGDPGLVHAALHALHDEVQQHVHRLVHVVAVCSARLKVRDPEDEEEKVSLYYKHGRLEDISALCCPQG